MRSHRSKVDRSNGNAEIEVQFFVGAPDDYCQSSDEDFFYINSVLC